MKRFENFKEGNFYATAKTEHINKNIEVTPTTWTLQTQLKLMKYFSSDIFELMRGKEAKSERNSAIKKKRFDRINSHLIQIKKIYTTGIINNLYIFIGSKQICSSLATFTVPMVDNFELQIQTVRDHLAWLIWCLVVIFFARTQLNGQIFIFCTQLSA